MRRISPGLAIAAAAVVLPFVAPNLYYLHIATMIAVYWVLIGTLNLLVGYTGQLSVGHVGLLAIGAYAFCLLGGEAGWPAFLALAAAGAITAGIGFLLGLPSLRFPGFYFAMVTTAFGIIVTELALAWQWLTNGSIGMAAPSFPPPFDTPVGFYALASGLAAIVTLLTWNLARSMWGRAMIAVRDSTVAASSVAVGVYRVKLTVFVFSGLTAGLAGGLFASSQSYITPDAFILNLGLFFFVSIIIGGRGSILGPFVGAAVLAAVPEVVGSLQRYGTFFYGVILLLVVLLVPGGIGPLGPALVRRLKGNAGAVRTEIMPQLERLRAALGQGTQQGPPLVAEVVTKRFGGNVAVSAVTLQVRRGQIHGLIGPNGSGKTSLLNLLSGYYPLTSGAIRLGGVDLTAMSVQARPRHAIARTFQKPKLLGALTVLDNVMLGAWPHARASFVETAFWLGRTGREEAAFRAQALALLTGVGLANVAHRRLDSLEHTAQRFVEIARALAIHPDFILLDEPAGGLTTEEIEHLADIIRVLRDTGMGVLIVEHHTDFVFRVCDRVTTLDLGRIIAAGLPKDVQCDPEVVRVYLGA
jgi:branched-chain amino acid transport system permease protein